MPFRPATLESFIRNLSTLCAIDSPTGFLDGVDACASALADICDRIGCKTDLVPTPNGKHLVASVHGHGRGRIILLGHHDTVHPAGTAAAHPLRIDSGRVFGPGSADMKGGLALGVEVLRELSDETELPLSSVELHSVPDEEARNGPPALLDRLTNADAVICLESGRPRGAFVSARKAGVWLTLVAEGRAAHAGTDRAAGRSALTPLLLELRRIEALNESRPGAQVTVTQFMAGEAKNTVPSRAVATVDIRADTFEDLQALITQVRGFGAYAGVKLRCSDESGFPPMRPSPGLIEMMSQAFTGTGLSPSHVATSGVSDANWTSHCGIPTIDGLGPIGHGDHTLQENIELSSVIPRIRALTQLCRSWHRSSSQRLFPLLPRNEAAARTTSASSMTAG